jgi:quercetin dioxygenase-like cupin family protein
VNTVNGFFSRFAPSGMTLLDSLRTYIAAAGGSMKIIKTGEIPKNIATSPLFIGGQVIQQPIITPAMSKFFNVSLVTFAPGARNKFHAHTTDQVLIVTAGKGIVATENEQIIVTTGDVIQFPAGEKHWHGATKDSSFAHIYFTGVESKTTQLEQ